MTAREFGEWFVIWQWQPWGAIAQPPADVVELDPLSFAKQIT